MESHSRWQKDFKSKNFHSQAHHRGRKTTYRSSEIYEWVTSTIRTLRKEVEQLESEIERRPVNSRGGKRGGEEMARKQNRITQNKFHILKLRQIKHALNDEKITEAAVEEIKEDVNEYVESLSPVCFSFPSLILPLCFSYPFLFFLSSISYLILS